MIPKNWISETNVKKGALHKKAKAPEDKKIPESTLKAAEAKGGRAAIKANLAETLRRLRKKR